ncbi:hypothetical protein LC613_37315 [Nostoc sphaeroides CHAB 2801]|uniref:hypothetical protein n=1 Tax=Nostoc sphaeroides TaxID=446679 RepID=UPI003977D11F|nr:hypothetical protein [Nostoc sphaeroides CHAB 2801]
MAISSDLIQKILPLLRPLMENESQRRGYLIRALGTNTPVQYHLVLNTPTNNFIPIYVGLLLCLLLNELNKFCFLGLMSLYWMQILPSIEENLC